MQEEMKKKNKNNQKLKDLMDLTFRHRRKGIVEENTIVTSVRMQYPALFTSEEVNIYHAVFLHALGCVSYMCVLHYFRHIKRNDVISHVLSKIQIVSLAVVKSLVLVYQLTELRTHCL